MKRKAPAPEGRDGEQKPTNRIKMAPRGIARSGGRSAHQAGPTPPRPSAVAKDAKALGSRVPPPPTNGGSARASSEEDVAVTLSPVSCHGSNNSLGGASLPTSRTATDDAGTNNNHHRRNGANDSANNPDRLEGDSSDSDDYSLLHSSTDRSVKGEKHSVIKRTYCSLAYKSMTRIEAWFEPRLTRPQAPAFLRDITVRTVHHCNYLLRHCSMKSSRVTQVCAGRFAALDLQTLACETGQGANLSHTTGFH